MPKKKRKECRNYRCKEAPFIGGLCEKHHLENEREQIRHDAAITALNQFTIDGQPPEHEQVRTELQKVCSWWNRARASEYHGIADEILSDEAKFAVNWCIGIARELVDQERALRSGDTSHYQEQRSFALKQYLWERFNNLERGLKSNGAKRKS